MTVIDKTKNTTQVAKGRVKEAVGRATGRESLEAEGAADRSIGNIKQAVEKLKTAARGLKR